jgi:hypothetical protein
MCLRDEMSCSEFHCRMRSESDSMLSKSKNVEEAFKLVCCGLFIDVHVAEQMQSGMCL